MSEHTKFTPGPWKANDLGYVGTAESQHGWILISIPAAEIEADGHFIKLPSEEEQKANIRLIAAAPELLEALEDCVAILQKFTEPKERQAVVKQAQAALAKAGESKCDHREMVENKDDPNHVWKCVKCGYVFA